MLAAILFLVVLNYLLGSAILVEMGLCSSERDRRVGFGTKAEMEEVEREDGVSQEAALATSD